MAGLFFGVDQTLARYGKLIRLQLQKAEGFVSYRTVQWQLAHRYLVVREVRYRVVKG